jgi:glycosyltransferase involved in cell wall biosynthesis
LILHINTAKTWRGGEQQLFYLAMGLKKTDFPQIIVGLPHSVLEAKCKEESLPFVPVSIFGEWDIFAGKKIATIAKKNGIQLIHTHTAKAHSIGLLAKFFYPSLKLIVSRRVDFSIRKNHFSKRKYFSAKNDMFLCVSNQVKKILLEDGVNPEKLLTVHSGIDLKKFSSMPDPSLIRSEFSISDNQIIIGNVAALVDHKDQETLLKSIPHIQTNIPFVFMIVGSGELESKLKLLAKELQVEDKVIFTGYRTDVLSFLSAFDIFTLTSKEEGLGTSVLDAMASNLPLVVTDGGGIGEMVEHEKGGFVSRVGDSMSLAKAYSILIERQDLREKFAKFNLKQVKQFSVNETIKKTIQVYKTFINL